MKTQPEFKIGDLVSHAQRPYTGIIVEVITTLGLSYERKPMYKVAWEHGEWMYELEEQLKIEVRAKNV